MSPTGGLHFRVPTGTPDPSPGVVGATRARTEPTRTLHLSSPTRPHSVIPGQVDECPIYWHFPLPARPAVALGEVSKDRNCRGSRPFFHLGAVWLLVPPSGGPTLPRPASAGQSRG